MCGTQYNKAVKKINVIQNNKPKKKCVFSILRGGVFR